MPFQDEYVNDTICLVSIPYLDGYIGMFSYTLGTRLPLADDTDAMALVCREIMSCLFNEPLLLSTK